MSIEKIIYILDKSNAILQSFAWLFFASIFCFACNSIVWVSAVYFSDDTEAMKRIGILVDTLNPQFNVIIIWVLLPLVIITSVMSMIVLLWDAFNSDSEAS